MEQILKLSFIFGLFALFRKVHGDLQSNVSNPDAFPDNRFVEIQTKNEQISLIKQTRLTRQGL